MIRGFWRRIFLQRRPRASVRSGQREEAHPVQRRPRASLRSGQREEAHRVQRRPRASLRSGSLRELAPIALPIVLSQAIDVLMLFCDRLFVSQIGKEQLAATLSGGILTFMMTTLVTGTLGQINPLVAQYRGANRPHDATRVVHQGFLFVLFFAPAVFFLSRAAAPEVFSFFNHGGVLLSSELGYFEILSMTLFTAALRQVFANFFIGIGETRMVTVASITAVALNLPLAYALTFGAWGLPRMGMKGAAWATVIAGFLPIGIFAVRFFSTDLRQLYNTSMRPRFDAGIFRQLVRFGLPAGLETFVNVGGFTFFTMVMYSYSPDVAAATTIVLNWDMVSFLPLLGISQGASSLVGRYLGAGKKKLALRSAWSGLKAGWLYSIMITSLYLSATVTLIVIFAPRENVVSFDGVVAIGKTMLRISCIYFFFDATYSVLGGILKGAGDTLWTMLVSNTAMWSAAVLVYQFKERVALSPIGAWWVLTAMVSSLGVLFFLRFIQGKWLNRLMISA
jgi:MATE family multidrug resistance protein